MALQPVSARMLCGRKIQKFVVNFLVAFNNLAQKSCHDSPRQGFVFGKELPIGSACGNGDSKGRFQSHVDTRHLHSGRGNGNTGTASEAMAVVKNRQQQGIMVDSYTFVDALKRCLDEKDLLAARQLHDCIVQSGMDQNPYVATTLLNVYAKCGRLQDARRVFDGLLKKDALAWSIMIGAYASNDNADDALQVFIQMRQAGCRHAM